jgi:hypothetical protein
VLHTSSPLGPCILSLVPPSSTPSYFVPQNGHRAYFRPQADTVLVVALGERFSLTHSLLAFFPKTSPSFFLSPSLSLHLLVLTTLITFTVSRFS